jgi:activator of HSP90 ATPase
MANDGVAGGHAALGLEFTFQPKDGGTEVTMVHSKVPGGQVESYRQGWVDYYWMPLKEYFEKKK